MRKPEDIEDVLLVGTTSQIEGLSGIDASYRYSPNSTSFEVRVGNEFSKMHKLSAPPNCVSVYGDAHSF